MNVGENKDFSNIVNSESKNASKKMKSLTNRSKLVVNKQMTFMERIYLPVIAKGMLVTLKHFFRKSVTIRYPEVKRLFAAAYRGLHVLKKEETQILKQLGLKIKKLRHQQGISRTQLAFEIKSSEKHLNRIEDGVVNTSVIKLFQIAEVLGIKPEDLLKTDKK